MTTQLFAEDGAVGTTGNTGGVGIGNSYPQKKLDVSGDIAMPTNSFLFLNSSDNNWRIGRSDSSNAPFSTQAISANRLNIVLSNTSGEGFAIGYADGNDNSAFEIGSDGSNPIVYMAGKVGIGTATPGQKLEVSGNIKGQGLIVGSSNAPSATVAGMLWYDTTAGQNKLKIRNIANTAWNTLWQNT